MSASVRWRLLLALVIVGTVAAVIGLAVGPFAVTPPVVVSAAQALANLPVGMFLVRHRPGNRLSWLVLVMGLAGLLGVMGNAYQAAAPMSWLVQWAWWPAIGLVPVVLLLFPGGRARGRPSRWLVGLVAGCVAASTVSLAAAALWAPRTLTTEPDVPLPAAAAWLVQVAIIVGAPVLLLVPVLVLVVVVRAVRAHDAERRQYLTLLPAVVLVAAGAALDMAGVSYATAPAAAALSVGLAVSIMQYRFDDLDLLVNRGLVWLTMTVVLALAWAGVLVLVSGEPVTGPRGLAGFVLAGLVAAVADPLRRGVQRAVDRWILGSRDEPQVLLGQLGARLAAAGTPVDVLRLTTDALIEAYRLPYAAVVLNDGAGESVVAESGRHGVPPVRYPLSHDGRVLGALLVSPRSAGERFTAREHRVLTELARQAGVAAHAHQLTLQLVASRGRIVRAREVERLRLRRDLHDGLGPVLAGSRMQLAAAARGSGVPETTAAALREVAGELASAGQTVRELINDLRPSSLEDGLAVAADRLAGSLLGDISVTVRVDDDLAGLPPEVEIAAFRILSEALTNIARHARASTCRVEIGANGDLTLVITDDGIGLGSARAGRAGGDGVGMGSMAERADELGGTVEVGPGPDGVGTRVTAVLPIGAR